MSKLFQRYDKYLILKTEDIDAFLTVEEKIRLDSICLSIKMGRASELKELSPNYVAVSESNPFYDIIWKLIEFSETKTPDEVEILRTNLDVEL